jgi:hypothetical protein
MRRKAVSDMARYIKKPIEVEAYKTDKEMIIHTLEGDMKANVGDYIITGIKGEQYPCKPEIFEATYEISTADVVPKSEIIDAFVQRLKEKLYTVPTVYNAHFRKLIDDVVTEIGDEEK